MNRIGHTEKNNAVKCFAIENNSKADASIFLDFFVRVLGYMLYDMLRTVGR